MFSNDFEEAFSNFLERSEYDEAEAALFAIVRLSFVAGWLAAGGQPPQSQRIFELLESDGPAEEPPPAPPPQNLLQIGPQP